jgi:hypothetical protein
MVNFAENYPFEIQNEVQNMHWYLYQHIWYTRSHHNLDFDPNGTIIFNRYHFIFQMIANMIMNLCNITSRFTTLLEILGFATVFCN